MRSISATGLGRHLLGGGGLVHIGCIDRFLLLLTNRGLICFYGRRRITTVVSTDCESILKAVILIAAAGCQLLVLSKDPPDAAFCIPVQPREASSFFEGRINDAMVADLKKGTNKRRSGEHMYYLEEGCVNIAEKEYRRHTLIK